MAAVIPSKVNGTTSPTWEEILGSKNWEGLVKPELNLSLREFILRCGNFCQATYDAFNSNTISPNCGNSRYPKDSFFRDVVLENPSRYQVVAFIYATSGIGDTDNNFFIHPADSSIHPADSSTVDPWDHHSNWMGYVAITTDKVSRAIGRREVYIAWRGTITTSEWISNIFGAVPVSVKPLLGPSSRDQSSDRLWWFGEPNVHSGWLSIYTSANVDSKYVKESARKQIHGVIEEIKNKYKGEKISVVVTGHSLGGAMATLTAFDLAENKVAGDDVLVSAFVFGCPQVGNQYFKDLVDKLSNLKIFHTHNIRDIVPALPDFIFLTYLAIETADLEIDTDKSPFLESKLHSEKIGDWHNLEANLHAVAWWNGPNQKFGDTPKVKRSLALVNKSCRFLISKLKIPESWWVEKNKGMEYDESTGEWVLDPPLPADQMLKINLN